MVSYIRLNGLCCFSFYNKELYLKNHGMFIEFSYILVIVYKWTDWKNLLKKLSLFFFNLNTFAALCKERIFLSSVIGEERFHEPFGPGGSRIKFPSSGRRKRVRPLVQGHVLA